MFFNFQTHYTHLEIVMEDMKMQTEYCGQDGGGQLMDFVFKCWV
jgi:hypothetical protein